MSEKIRWFVAVVAAVSDLTQLLWQERILSVWPNESLFYLVPKGKYWLSLEMNVNKQKMNSNRVEVRIE